MNIIRTTAVELTTIPAIAYKQKLSAGGAGIKIMLLDSDATAVFTIDKRTGELAPYGVVDESLFPMEVADEAFELTSGLPFSARGTIKLTQTPAVQPDDVPEDAEPDQVDMTLSPEYKELVERYSDEKGKLNYQLMNKDFMQFASKSKVVSEMVGMKAGQADILTFVVKNRAAFLASQKEGLDDESVQLLIESLDEIDPRSAFKELKAYITRLLSKKR